MKPNLLQTPRTYLQLGCLATEPFVKQRCLSLQSEGCRELLGQRVGEKSGEGMDGTWCVQPQEAQCGYSKAAHHNCLML